MLESHHGGRRGLCEKRERRSGRFGRIRRVELAGRPVETKQWQMGLQDLQAARRPGPYLWR